MLLLHLHEHLELCPCQPIDLIEERLLVAEVQMKDPPHLWVVEHLLYELQDLVLRDRLTRAVSLEHCIRLPTIGGDVELLQEVGELL